MKRLLWIGPFALFALAPSSWAAPRLELSACALDRAEIERLVAIETAHDPQAKSVTVVVRCEADFTHVHVGRVGETRTAHTALDLATSPPNARARIVALAVADLMAWSEANSQSRATSAGANVETVRAPPLPGERPEPGEAWHVMAGAQMRSFVAHDLHLGGLTTALTRQGVRWAHELALSLGRGSRQRPTADATFTTVNVGGLLWWQHRRQSWAWRTGLGAEAGHVWVSGRPARGGEGEGLTHTAFTWTPMAAVAARYHAFPRTAFELRMTAGYVLAPIVGVIGNGDDVRLAGPWLGLSLAWLMGANGTP